MQANGLGVLGNFASDPEFRKSVHDEGGARIAIDAIKEFPLNAEVTGNALALLANISTDTHLRKDMSKGDVIMKLVMNALQKHSKVAHVQTSGLILVR